MNAEVIDLKRIPEDVGARARLGEDVDGSFWWDGKKTSPTEPGPYRRKSKLGAILDWWDGALWRRIHSSMSKKGGRDAWVVCANQDLPWQQP